MYEIEEMEEADPHYYPGHRIEARSHFKERALRGLSKAFALHPTPFVVSHGRLFLSLCEALEVPMIRQIPNLTIIEFTKADSKWRHNILQLEIK